MKEEKRVALDGHSYTAQEFQDFYGERSWQFYWDSAEREHSVDKPVADSVDKPVESVPAPSVNQPVGPGPASEWLTTDSAELKNTSSVDKPATADEDLPPPSPPLPASGQQHPPPPTPVLLNPVVPPPPPKATTTAAPQLIKLRGRKDIQQAIFNPLRAAITGTFPHWQLPTFLTTEDDAHIAFDQLENTFEIDWRTCSKTKATVLENLQVLSWTVQFFEDEPDPTPPDWRDRPRLDAVLQLSDGTWARWHTSGHIILSTQRMPTDAMQIRMNRYRALVKLLEKREGQR